MNSFLHLIKIMLLASFRRSLLSKSSFAAAVPAYAQTSKNLMRRFAAAMVMAAGSISVAHGQIAPGTSDATFNTADKSGLGEGFDNNVQSIVLQPDGRMVVVGFFTSYNGTDRNRIARLNADGSIDDSFDPGTAFSGSARTIALQPDGKIVVGGGFTIYNDTVRNRIVRLNADGSIDESFSQGTGFNNTVESIALQPDGKLIVGGWFTSYNGTDRNRIARLHLDGTLDTSFNPGTGFNTGILSIALQPDGKLLVGGEFISYNGTDRNRIARLNADGSLDTSFNPGTGFNNSVLPIILQTDGKIVIGGKFTSYNNTDRNRIVRLNTDGTLDASFHTGTGFSSDVEALALLPDGKLVVGGRFSSYNGSSRSFLVRLNSDGNQDFYFSSGTGFSGSVQSIALQPDGKLVTGGRFISYNNSLCNRIARLNANSTLDASFNLGNGFNNTVETIALQPDGKMVVGGVFTSYNGTDSNRIVRLNADGSRDTSFNFGTGFSSSVQAIALQPDGKLVVGGGFWTYNGTARNGIARLNANGSLDTSFNPALGTVYNNAVQAIVLQPDGKIVIGGGWINFNNSTHSNRIIRLNADGTIDASFDPGTGFEREVESIALQPDGKLVVGGAFTTYNGTARNGIARLNTDGTLDTSFNPGTGFAGTVRSIVLQPDGKMLTGGWFTSYNGRARNHIARLNADGTLDTYFNQGPGFDGSVRSIALQPDGKVVAGGWFSNYNGTDRNWIARLHAYGSLDDSFNPGTGFNSLVVSAIYSIALQPDGKMVVGGGFSTYNNISRRGIARLHGDEGSALNAAREQQAGLDVQVYPNPSRGDVNLALSGAAASGVIQLVLYNALGRQVLTKEVQAAETKSGMKLSMPDLASGIYFLRLSTRDTHITKKLVLEK